LISAAAESVNSIVTVGAVVADITFFSSPEMILDFCWLIDDLQKVR
jgi:hypothetical protein